MSGISYTHAQLLGVFLECLMYGIFVTLLVAACYVQWERFLENRIVNHLMTFATVFFWLSATINFCISLYRAIRAILFTPPGATVFMSPGPPFHTDSVIWLLVFNFQSTMTDIIVAYRMYHIYVLFATGCVVTRKIQAPATPRNLKSLAEWSSVGFGLSLFNSLFLTAAIAVRLWCVHRETVRAGIQVEGSTILRVMRVVIESAALWTVFTTANFFTYYVAKSNLTFTSLAMSGPAAGISFCLIIVRLGHVSPVARDETWHSSTLASRPSASDPIPLSFAQVKVQQDTCPSESENLPMEALESQKHEYINPPGDLPKVVQTSTPLPTLG